MKLCPDGLFHKHFLFVVFIGFLQVFSACSTSRKNVTDANNPNYHEGKMNPFMPGIQPTSDPVGATVEATLALALVKDYYKDPRLGGSCLFEEVSSNQLPYPCQRVQVYLLDEKRNQLSATQTDGEGQFSFFTKSPKNYYLRIAKSNTNDEKVWGPLHSGDRVVLSVLRGNPL